MPSFFLGGIRGSIATSGSCQLSVCHRGLHKALSRCRLVGSCVRPGENFFPAYDQVRTLDTITGNLEVDRLFITIRSMSDASKFLLFFHFFNYVFTFSFPALPW